MRTAKVKIPTTITCEQVYHVWSTEPDLLRIYDLRPPEAFEGFHIPGSLRVSIAELDARVLELQGRLGVLIVPEDQRADVERRYAEVSDVALLTDCHRWRDLNHPLGGQSVESIRSETSQRKPNMTHMKNEIIFHQLFETESSTYTYLIADAESKEAALIDPVRETVERDLKLVEELGLRLMYVLDTHVHADHITAAAEIRDRTGAKTAISQNARVQGVDIALEDGQELSLGRRKIRAIATPGHTDACMSFFFEDRVFTGDTLLIRGTGRTDFQSGSAAALYDSVVGKLFQLPDETVVYPGHDYRGQTSSTIGTEKAPNLRLGGQRTKEEFIKIMAELNLPKPKKIHEAVPANMTGGRVKEERLLHPQFVDGIPEVSVEDVRRHLGRVRLIDVRRPEEFNNELGHIPGARLLTLGPELTRFLEEGDRAVETVFVCRSGARSGQATAESLRLGYKLTANMVGGMIRWNEMKFPLEEAQ